MHDAPTARSAATGQPQSLSRMDPERMCQRISSVLVALEKAFSCRRGCLIYANPATTQFPTLRPSTPAGTGTALASRLPH